MFDVFHIVQFTIYSIHDSSDCVCDGCEKCAAGQSSQPVASENTFSLLMTPEANQHPSSAPSSQKPTPMGSWSLALVNI